MDKWRRIETPVQRYRDKGLLERLQKNGNRGFVEGGIRSRKRMAQAGENDTSAREQE